MIAKFPGVSAMDSATQAEYYEITRGPWSEEGKVRQRSISARKIDTEREYLDGKESVRLNNPNGNIVPGNMEAAWSSLPFDSKKDPEEISEIAFQNALKTSVRARIVDVDDPAVILVIRARSEFSTAGAVFDEYAADASVSTRIATWNGSSVVWAPSIN